MTDTTSESQPSVPPQRFCPACRTALPLELPTACPQCGISLGIVSDQTPSRELSTTGSATWSDDTYIALVPEHVPAQQEVKFAIGPYQIVSSIGKGGMGEVFLAYDTVCGRRIALKRIREDLVERQQLHNRFLKEARITSQLTHPAIIPIYSIHASDEVIYYTMPYVEGETLKQILRRTRTQEQKGEKLHHIGGSIPALTRIFMTICQAVAYAHAHRVLHRDLKPENVIIGRYGQVMILDWGLAKLYDRPDTMEEGSFKPPPRQNPNLTRLGKIVGTTPYMAPERVMGNPATVQTDIFALGVILYQCLALQMPFGRPTLKELRRTMAQRGFVEPSDVAPYREIPPTLSRIAAKCLAFNVEQRYKTVDELVHDLETHMEGRSEWFQLTELDVHNKADWEFQENVLLAEHIEITRSPDASAWVSLMVSRCTVPENTKIEAKVRLGDKGSGIGFLLSVPEASERVHINDGYCLWIGSKDHRDTKLLRSTVEVISAPEVYLHPNVWYNIRIEKVDSLIGLYIDDQLQFSFVSHLPLIGTHVGLLSRDHDFQLKDCYVYAGGQNLTVSCLAVPDAFLAHRDYTKALAEYRRIGNAFPGRAEGREALFRAGLTLLEQGKSCPDTDKRTQYYDQALEEFEKLHQSAGAPLEYLGKAIVYQTLEDHEEEVKSLELALRRYPHHPLIHVLQEHVMYRLHDSARHNRLAAYHFILLVVRCLPRLAVGPDVQRLMASLQKNWEPLPFINLQPIEGASRRIKNLDFAIQLAFWVAKPYLLAEMLEKALENHTEGLEPISVGNALFCLIELGSFQMAFQLVSQMRDTLPVDLRAPLEPELELMDVALLAHTDFAKAIKAALALPLDLVTHSIVRLYVYLMENAITREDPSSVYKLAEALKHTLAKAEDKLLVDVYTIWAYLLEGRLEEAGALLHSYPSEKVADETSPLHFLHGCWLDASEGRQIAEIHFSGVLDVAYPRIWSLLGHYVSGRIAEDGWFRRAFMWEKRMLYRQLTLFYHCAGERQKAEAFRLLESKEYTENEG